MEKQLMNPGCIVLRNKVCFFLITCFFSFQRISLGQTPAFDTIAFYKHLKEENLLMEQVVFAQKLRNGFSANNQRKDSLSLDLAVAYFRMKIPDSCIANLKRILAENQFSEKKKELYISLLMLTKEYGMAENKTSILESKNFIADVRASFSILKREKADADTLYKTYSPGIFDLRNRYILTPHASPFLAGTFSALLPGAGKWYIGYKRQAWTAFIANALFAAQAAESYVRAGVSSPQFIITAGLFGIFYSGNIWGSVLAAKKKKRDHLNEMDHEILGHYYTEFSRLYR